MKNGIIEMVRSELSFGDLWEATSVVQPTRSRGNGHLYLVAQLDGEIPENHLPPAKSQRQRPSAKDVTGFGLLEDAVDPRSIESPASSLFESDEVFPTLRRGHSPVQPLMRYLRTLDTEGHPRTVLDLMVWLAAARSRGIVGQNGHRSVQ